MNSVTVKVTSRPSQATRCRAGSICSRPRTICGVSASPGTSSAGAARASARLKIERILAIRSLWLNGFVM